ncbi:VWA domain-containing protein [Gallaecimonas sp. GXIMD4217]|uniref:VWA domain-containing protein n=1 Tax=Gallaecimonas sp. GXIMD4217 TaxID=3131927 RepID=UPI00311B090E
MLEWLNPWALLLLPLPLLWRWLPHYRKPKLQRLLVPGQVARGALAEESGSDGRVQSPLWLWPVWLLLLAALARPIWVGEPLTLPDNRREMMLLVDLSGSMKQQDMHLEGRPISRLQAAKLVLADFIRQRQGDRLGLVLFGDHAYVQAPLSHDLDTIATLLGEAEWGLAGNRTAIGEAVGMAAKRLKDRSTPDKVAILLTDGQNTAGDISPQQGLQAARQLGLTLYTIGFGTDYQEKKTPFGTIKVPNDDPPDEALLRQLADSTGGRYFRAQDLETLEAIYDELNRLEPISDNQQVLRPRKDVFAWPLALALLLSLALALWRLR